jgi:FdhD protein
MIDDRPARPGPSVETRIVSVESGAATPQYDRVATEEPLEIRMRAGGNSRTVAITMRTPGNDFELAAGFLHNEGILGGFSALHGMSYCLDGSVSEDQQYNVVNVDLAASELPALDAFERHFTMTSACGVCGRAQLEALEERGLTPVAAGPQVAAATLITLPQSLRAAQGIFEKTGGLHAAGLFSPEGELIAVREDVGRNNALDKLIGWALMERRLPLERFVLVVSGRSSYEIVQKAVVARIPIVCAVSAPSSLAVAVARRFGLTLVGFLRAQRFNIYAGEQRLSA